MKFLELCKRVQGGTLSISKRGTVIMLQSVLDLQIIIISSKTARNTSVFPDIEDITNIPSSDIEKKLPKPRSCHVTEGFPYALFSLS